NVAPQPAAPLAALKDALSGTIAASRQLIAEFKRAESIPATPTGESKGIAPPAESAPPPPVKTSITPLPEPTVNRAPAAEPAPGEVIAGAAAALPYSSYAASRLLSEPFDPGMIAPEAAGQQSRISAVITYNLAELRRTAGDIYEYFTQ
ncbi:MAG: hypothetical protein Q8R35_03745, partial [bacterium]|nr:hypothetical protein [bacterium]